MRRIFTLAMSIALLAGPPFARADDAAVLYDPGSVTTIDLALSPAGIQALRDEPKTYVDANVVIQRAGQTLGPYAIGVKLKGNYSFRDIDGKSSFRLKFAHSVKGQKILGLKGVTLNNMIQDKAMLHETASYTIFRAAGVPAPRTGYAYVRVNGAPYGLYLNLEPYDTVSLARLFPGGTGHLYEGESSADVNPDRRGAFEVDEGDEDDVSDLDALIAAATSTSGDWSDGMAATADLDEMTTMWAGESFVGHWDGYSVADDGYLPNNYYIHSDPDGVFTMMPNGADQSLVLWKKPIGEGRSQLFTRCKADASCWQDWRDALAEVSGVYRDMNPGALLGTAMDTVNRWRTCAGREWPTEDQWRGNSESTLTFLRERRKEVADYLGFATPSVPALPDVPATSTDRVPGPGGARHPDAVAHRVAVADRQPGADGRARRRSRPRPRHREPAAVEAPSPAPEPEPAVGTPAPADCRVPKLAGHSLAASRRRLAVAHCATGKVVRRKRPARGKWRVKATRPGAGAVRPHGTKVVVIIRRRR